MEALLMIAMPNRPLVRVNVALTADGAMVREGGADISCKADWRRVHEVREKSDAVGVGGRTWEQDRPRLTCREDHLGRAPRRQPAWVVFSGSRRAEVPPGPSPVFVVGRHPSPGARWVLAPDHDLAGPLTELRRQGITSLLVEGGRTLLGSFVAQRLVDEATAYVATRDLGRARAVAESVLPGLPPFLGAVPLGKGTLVTFNARLDGPVVRRDFRQPVSSGVWRASVLRVGGVAGDYLALWLGDLEGEATLVRVHSQCLTGDVFGSARCDCGAQLLAAVRRIGAAGRGLVVYLPQEGRGIGLLAKASAYALQDSCGLDTRAANEALGLPADARDYTAAARILREFGIASVLLLTNNPQKIAALRRAGVAHVERVPLVTKAGPENGRYLAAKVAHMGHYEDLLKLVNTIPSPRGPIMRPNQLPTIAVLCTSPEERSRSRTAARFACQVLREEGLAEIDWLDLHEKPIALYPGLGDDPARDELVARFNAADAWLIATPVHNWSAAAATWSFLNHALDDKGRRHRPVLIVAGAGSTRSLLALDGLARTLLHEVHAVLVGPPVVAAGDDVDRQAGTLGPDLQRRLRASIAALAHYAGAGLALNGAPR
jgi:GTP cyclohydrolase II